MSAFFTRADGQRHHEFLKELRGKWGHIWRIRLGERGKSIAPSAWLKENIVGECAACEGREVWYFSDEQDSIMFKMRFS